MCGWPGRRRSRRARQAQDHKQGIQSGPSIGCGDGSGSSAASPRFNASPGPRPCSAYRPSGCSIGSRRAAGSPAGRTWCAWRSSGADPPSVPAAPAPQRRRGVKPGGQRHPRVAGRLHHHQHLRRVGALRQHGPQPCQILRRGAEPTADPNEPALLIGEADLVSGSTRDVDAQASGTANSHRTIDSGTVDRPLPHENEPRQTFANRDPRAVRRGRQVPNRVAGLRQQAPHTNMINRQGVASRSDQSSNDDARVPDPRSSHRRPDNPGTFRAYQA